MRRWLAKFGQYLRDLPIREKLVVVMVVTTAVAILLSGLGIVGADAFLFRNYMRDDIRALARIIDDNLAATLAFDDPAAARQTLASLRARTHVISACVYTPTKETFAVYARQGADTECPISSSSGERIVMRRDRMYVFRELLLRGKQQGTLVIAYDLRESSERFWVFGAIVFAVLVVSTAAALASSGKLRATLTTPVEKLARATMAVSKSRDYSIRAEKTSKDELGLLVDAFNDMLASIQLRDNELAEALAQKDSALEELGEARQSVENTLQNVAKLNEELRKSNEDLAQSNQDLERFAFVASHDLQEPLRLISVHSQLLLRRYGSQMDEKATQWLHVVENAAKRMRLLLSDLLAYAEIGAQSQAAPGEVDLNTVLQRVRENLSVVIDENSASIHSDDLPIVIGLESNLVPLLQNLIANAIKYRRDENPEIRVSASRANGDVQICVQDNGVGIAPEYYSRIFEPFKRLHGSEVPGTGIGLAICQRVVEKCGGRIWVESMVGVGSQFVFTLPQGGRKGGSHG